MPASPESSTTWPSPRLRLRPAPQQQFEFFFPPDKLGQSARVESLETAFDRSGSQCRPSPHRPRDALEVLCSKVLKLEQVAHELSRALRNDHAVRLCNALQARGKVRRLADDGLLLRSARADQVADNHQPRCDAIRASAGARGSSEHLQPRPTPAPRARPALRRPRGLGDTRSRSGPHRPCTSLRSHRSAARSLRRTSGRPK